MGEDLLSAFSNLKKKEPTFSPGQLTPVSTAPMTPKPQPAQESALSAFASKAAQKQGSHPALAVASTGAQPTAQRSSAPAGGDSPLSLFNAATMKSRPVSTAPASRPESAQKDFAPREFRQESPQRKARVLTDDDVQLSGGLDMIYSDKKEREQKVYQYQQQSRPQVRVTPLISQKERDAARPAPVPSTEEARLAAEKERAKKRVLEEWKKRASMMR